MQKIISVTLAVLLLIAAAGAQVLSPSEMPEDGTRALQDKYFDQLKQFAAEARGHRFPYPFFFSRVLDVEQPQQAEVDQRSIRFDTYNGQVVLEVTGNYFASYSERAMDFNHRVRQDFHDVVLPLLRILEPRLAGASGFQAYAFEVSHHVRGKVIGVTAERAENVVFVFPRGAAERLLKATTTDQQQAAVLDSRIFVDGDPFMMWLTGDPPKGSERPREVPKPAHTETVSLESSSVAAPIDPTVNPKLLGLPEPPPRIVNSSMLGNLAVEYDSVITRLTRELGSEAQFVPYVAPSFIDFRNGAYLQLPMNTQLDVTFAGSSRYKLAALAFDEHIARLVRPLVAYFPNAKDFDGVDFSASVKVSSAPAALAVEFILPLDQLRCYANSACTGQQLLNSGAVLINGGRVTLDLETAEK
ncbi:MAG: hypothetical protein ACRD3E_12350 [Terriglobales bacterium]